MLSDLALLQKILAVHLPSKTATEPQFIPSLGACIDANVLISALAFGGKPLLIIDRLLAGDFI
jgi:hypothetical protein